MSSTAEVAKEFGMQARTGLYRLRLPPPPRRRAEPLVRAIFSSPVRIASDEHPDTGRLPGAGTLEGSGPRALPGGRRSSPRVSSNRSPHHDERYAACYAATAFQHTLDLLEAKQFINEYTICPGPSPRPAEGRADARRRGTSSFHNPIAGVRPRARKDATDPRADRLALPDIWSIFREFLQRRYDRTLLAPYTTAENPAGSGALHGAYV